MKMNNLNNPSRVILSNLARVILSKAKNPVLAASLVALVACTDYLEDFQDKYDDGNAFAEISSDGGNGDDDGKSSSSNGGDSELSSSSKGNGDAESSDSTDSSSSATDPGSSSSVAESSSSAFESCTGTVIYDAEEDLELNIFGRKFITYVQGYGPGSSKTSPDGVTAYLSQEDILIMPLVESPDTMNIEPWGGFCVEYTGSGVLHANVVDESSDNKPILLYKEMPNTNGEKSSFTWSWNENKGLMEKQEDNGSSEGFSIEKVELINFISYSGNSSITIHKITTLKPVDLGLSGVYNGLEPVSDCSEGSAQIIYAPEMKNESYWGTNFFSILHPETNATYNSTKNVLSMSMTALESYQMNMEGVNEGATKDWGGLCIEYEAGHPLFWSVSLLQNIELNQYTWDMGSEAAVVLPKTEGIQAYKISWKKFGELKNNSFAGIINTMQFHHAEADEYHAADKSYNIEDYKNSVNLGIRRITSYN